jgi:hypothetical protein
MRLAALRLRQRDGMTCGPTVAVVAGALLDPKYRTALLEPGAHAVAAPGHAWFADEQRRVHGEVNRIWPRRLGTTPIGMVHALNLHSAALGVRYRWRLFHGRRDRLSDVAAAVTAGWPVAMLIGRAVPRHWVLLVDAAGDVLQCYEPSSGAVVPVEPAAIRRARLIGLGYPRPFGFVVPADASLRAATLSATRSSCGASEVRRPATTPVRFRSGWFCDIFALPSTRLMTSSIPTIARSCDRT